MKRLLITLPVGLVALLVGGPTTAVVGVALVAPVVAALLPTRGDVSLIPSRLPEQGYSI